MTQPIELTALHRSAESESAEPQLTPEATWLSEVVKDVLGKQHIGDLIATLKRVMLVEALTRSAGNISEASELLGISRQGVQQMIQRTDLQGWVRRLRQDRRDNGDDPVA